jgi:hypothetical protein
MIESVARSRGVAIGKIFRSGCGVELSRKNQFGEHALSDTSIVGPFVRLRFVVSRVVGAI